MFPSKSARVFGPEAAQLSLSVGELLARERGCAAGREREPWHCTQWVLLGEVAPGRAFSGRSCVKGPAGFCLEKYAAGSFISALERFAAIGVICGSLRLPSRNRELQRDGLCRLPAGRA